MAMQSFKKMIDRVVTVSAFDIQQHGDRAVHKTLWHATRDMDSVVYQQELHGVGGTRVFVVKGTPK